MTIILIWLAVVIIPFVLWWLFANNKGKHDSDEPQLKRAAQRHEQEDTRWPK